MVKGQARGRGRGKGVAPRVGPSAPAEELYQLGDDPADSDYDDNAPTGSAPRKRKRGGGSAVSSRAPPRKKSRRQLDDDIVDDEDELSNNSWSDDAAHETTERNAAGRPVRSSTKGHRQYAESSVESSSPPSSEDEDEILIPQKGRAKGKQNRRRVSDSASASVADTHSRAGSAAPRQNQSNPRPSSSRGNAATRSRNVAAAGRTTRASKEPVELLELSASGRHARPVAPSQSRETTPALQPRRSVGGKGVCGKRPGKGLAGKAPQVPPPVAEESQEDSPAKTTARSQPTSVKGEEIADSREASAERAAEPQEVDMSDAEARQDREMVDAPEEEHNEAGDEENIVETVEEIVATINTKKGKGQKRKRNGEESESSYHSGESESDSDDDTPAKKKLRVTTESRSRTGSASTATKGSGRRGGRKGNNGRQKKSQRKQSTPPETESEEDLVQAELAEEIAELNPHGNSRRQSGRHQQKKNASQQDVEPEIIMERSSRKTAYGGTYSVPDVYSQFKHVLDDEVDDEGDTIEVEKIASGDMHLLSCQGPFGGEFEPAIFRPLPYSLLPHQEGDSDSGEDDEDDNVVRIITAQHVKKKDRAEKLAEEAQERLGKKKADDLITADITPLGIRDDVDFSNVGGLDDYVNQLKEMVILPLQYPELFQSKALRPPRGVLLHGPPGNGKTLLARALAAESTIAGKKITFFMRKGADVLNKYVGEAERQLRLVFEEAQRCQPAIIFFDEIDGLAPVRSSRQDQIHGSIVASLLALMDGMEDRGQVIVMGATNRPDNIDPALRRPGRFDREFFIPLPGVAARRAILDIHTKKWTPPLAPEFKDQLAQMTKGFSGADLQSLCVESALHAVQATYPQIYMSKQKLLVDPNTIQVLPKDFFATIKKIVPTSERSATITSSGTKKRVEPLVRTQADEIMKLIEEILPQRKHMTALQEAMYEDRNDPADFDKLAMEMEFDEARVHRPRLLISGVRGMGQQYLAKAVLQKLETTHMQAFDLPALLEDSSRTPEAAVIQLFKEVRRMKPAIIFIPNVDVWWETLEPRVAALFSQLLRAIDPNDHVLLLGIMEKDRPEDEPSPSMMNELFGFSSRGEYEIRRPDESSRKEFFNNIIAYIRMPPTKLPDPDNRQLRQLPVLPPAPIQTALDFEQRLLNLRRQRKLDLIQLNNLKKEAAELMVLWKRKYQAFLNAPLKKEAWAYLEHALLFSDLPPEQLAEMAQNNHLWTIGQDKDGIDVLRFIPEPRIYLYNLDTVTIEKRFEHGCYTRPKDLLEEIKRIAHDCKMVVELINLGYGKIPGHSSRFANATDKLRRATEMTANFRVDVNRIFYMTNKALCTELEDIHRRRVREVQVEKERAEREKLANARRPRAARSNASGSRPLTPSRPRSRGFAGEQHQSNGAVHQNGAAAPVMPSAAAHTATPSHLSQPHSQRSVLEKMAPGSIPAEYQNSASTTTSGQKTDPSHRTSDRSHAGLFPAGETQSTNGDVASRDFPNWADAGPLSGNSQIPDTQPSSGSGPESSQSAFSQLASTAAAGTFSVPPLPAHAARHSTAHPPSDLASVLNPARSEAPAFVLHEAEIAALHEELARRSSGLSVEQLEQTHAALMNAVWRHRGAWNRMVVAKAVEEAFNEVMADIERKQVVLQSSLEEEAARRRGF